jgi:transcriptional regulator with XRE-family HTH domain
VFWGATKFVLDREHPVKNENVPYREQMGYAGDMVNTYELLAGASTVGERIRRLLEAQGLTVSELHRRTAIAKGYLSELIREDENGSEPVRRKPSAETLYAVGTALGVSVADLLGHTRKDEDVTDWPPGLAEYVEKNDVSSEDARVLARISLRGRTPSTAEEWSHIHRTILMYTTGVSTAPGGR